MTTMLKNKVLAFVLAFAVLAVSLFTGVAVSHIHADAETAPVQTAEGDVDLLEFGEYLLEAGSTSKYWDTKLDDNGETGADWDNAIIIDSAEEFVYLCKASGDDTKGKYYKVADGIAGFNLANANLDVEGTLADNLDVILSAGKNHAGGQPGFQGHFDGNGATVYGAWSNHTVVSTYAGLFTATYGDVTIKNIHVNKAHFTAKNAVGGIIGYHAATDMCTVTIENCSITDSYLETQGTGYGHAVGALLGFGASAPAKREANDQVDYNGDGDMVDTIYINVAYNIKNCYVNLDEANFVSAAEDGTEASGERVCHGGVAGVLGSNALKVSDCVVIGIKPYAVMEGTSANDVQHSGLESHFANVYTTSDVAITDVNLGGTGALATRNFTDKVFPLTDAQLKGAAAAQNMDLDWSVWMADNEGYPELANAHKNVTLVNKENGTHAATCTCGFGGIAVDCTFVDGTCACGAELTCDTRKTIYWDGTVASGIATGTGTKDDPYIIKSAAEFAWLIQQKADVTTGKFYEIDDAIGTIVLQPEAMADAIIALDSAAAVKTYFETNAASAKPWPNVGWEGSSFCGEFDGNGVTVYGLYQVSPNNAGLFSTIDGGAAIKNIALKNSYLTSTATNYQVGGLAANTSSAGYGRKTTGAIWFESCVVANNYMYNPCTSHDRTGAIIGASSDVVYIDNCLVYGNDVSYGDGSIAAGIWSSANNSTIVSDSFVAPEGLVLEDDGAETPRYRNKVRNSVIFGVKPYDLGQQIGSRFNDPNCYTNVLTDTDIANDLFSNGKAMTVTDEQMKTVTLADLATAELGDAFINTATYPELKSFHDEVFSGDVEPAGAAGHSASCSCGLAGSDLQPHDFVLGEFENCVCSVCGYGCEHTDYELVEYEGDCVTAAGYKFDCNLCGYHEEELAEIAGHNFTSHDAKAGADCQTAGTIAYKSCDVCNKNYAADASDTEAFENAITDLTGELGECVVLKDPAGEIIYGSDGSNHWTICATCQQPITTEAHDGETKDNGNGTHSVTCTICLYAADAAPHTFVSDVTPAQWDSTYCSGCGLVCEHVSMEEGLVEYEGDCVTAAGYTFDCSICGYHEEEFAEIAGHNFTSHEAKAGADCQNEGTIAYKSCDVCNKNYAADAADTEAFENAITDLSDGVVGPCKSTATKFEYDANGHFKLCDLCGAKVEEAAHQGETTAHGKDGHAVECTICDFADDEAPHVFGGDNKCDTCNWECTAHNFVVGDVVVEGDCLIAEEKATACDICGIAGENEVAEIKGHDFYNEEGFAPTCISNGEKAHVYCLECGEYFAEGTTDKLSTDYIDYDTEISIPEDPDAHVMREVAAAEAECEKDGNIAFAYCEECGLLVVGEEETLLEEDEELVAIYIEKLETAYNEVKDQIETEEDLETIFMPIYYSIMDEYVIKTAAVNDIELSIAAAHELSAKAEVAATADKEGTKGHYACANCEKLFADAEGKTEVTADELVIEKLAGGDNGDKAPVTGESIAVVAAVAALMGAAFVIIRKARKA